MSEYLTVGGRTNRGVVRGNNEDSLIAADLSRASSVRGDFSWHRWRIGEYGLLLAVSDGMGGANGGEIASEMCVHLLCDYLQRHKLIETETLRDAIQYANESVFARSQSDSELSGMGATLTAIVIKNSSALIGHIGDTRAYLFRREEITRLTKDQSLVQSLVDAGVMTAADAETSPKRNIILSAVGHADQLDPQLSTIDLEPDDQLLLCTDGLSGLMKDFEIKNLLELPLTIEEKCDRYIHTANDRGGSDNITVIAARYRHDDLGNITEGLPVTTKFPRELF